jgi:hypothetical protein
MNTKLYTKPRGDFSVVELARSFYFYADFINGLYQFVIPKIQRFDNEDYTAIRLLGKFMLEQESLKAKPIVSTILQLSSDNTSHLILDMNAVLSEQAFDINLNQVLKLMPKKAFRELEYLAAKEKAINENDVLAVCSFKLQSLLKHQVSKIDLQKCMTLLAK